MISQFLTQDDPSSKFVPSVPPTPNQFYQLQWPPSQLLPPQHQPAPPFHPQVPAPPSAGLPLNVLNANAGAFVPRKKISIKDSSRQVTLETLERAPHAAVKNDIRWPIIESEEQEEPLYSEDLHLLFQRAKEEEREGKQIK